MLVTGAHRSGTTWVGKMLAAGGGLAYVSEPLNVLHRPGVMRAAVAHWYTFISKENEGQYLDALRHQRAFRYPTLHGSFLAQQMQAHMHQGQQMTAGRPGDQHVGKPPDPGDGVDSLVQGQIRGN